MEGRNGSEADKSSCPGLQQLQPTGSVPSIFLAPPGAAPPPPPPPVEGACSSKNAAPSVQWNGVEMAQVVSPPSSVASLDSGKMKNCVSTQCGNGSGYDSFAGGVPVGGGGGGGCQQQPSVQNRGYPAYVQQQQQHMSLRSMQQHHHHHHHHHGLQGPCHPQQVAMNMPPHLERMMHSGTPSMAMATAQHMRSVVMNHYHPQNVTGYSQQSSAPSSTYYHPTVTTASGSTAYMEYPQNGPHHHHHGISASTAAAVQYAQQQQHHQQRMLSSVTTLNPYRQLAAVHHQQKALSSSQAAAAYQNAYHQQQYTQYLQHQGLVATHHHPQNGPGTTTPTNIMHQRLVGVPLSNLQHPQQQQQAYINRTSQHLPQLLPQHQQQSGGYSAACQPALVSGYTAAAPSQQQTQPPQPLMSVMSSGSIPACLPTASAETIDANNNNSSSTNKSSSADVLGTRALSSKKCSVEAPIVHSRSSSMKLGALKLSTASPEKSVKLKASKSVTKLRDRQPRLVVGQKKKSAGNTSGSSGSKKLKSLKAGLALSGGVIIAETLNSPSKRLSSSSILESKDSGELRRSRKTVNGIVSGNPDGAGGHVSPTEETRDKEGEAEGEASCATALESAGPAEDREKEDEYVPTPEEMRRYLERLNTCNSLSIPLYYAYSVFHGKLAKKEGGSKRAPGDSSCSAPTSEALSAETEWLNFQEDMAVLEAYFPLLSTMEQSERAEKLDTIYTYESQVKLMNAANPAASSSCAGERMSPPCSCVQNTASCSCCFNYMGRMMAATEECANSGYVSEGTPAHYVIDPAAYHHHAHYMSTPISSRRAYAEGHAPFFDEDNQYYGKENCCSGSRTRPATRKRSSSYPSRKAGRRSSGSRDHLKSETESFLDELISTANEEKGSKHRNSSGELAAPEIQCEVDFPTLESSAALPYSKRQARHTKQDEANLSAREDFLASSSGGTEESESNTSACSSSGHSTHNTSSETDFEGGREAAFLGGRQFPGRCMAAAAKGSHPLLLPPSFCHFEQESSDCYGRMGHLWDEFRGDELVAMQPESAYNSSVVLGDTCLPVANLNHLISHCTCRRVDNLCPTRPPPGFEHLSRPAFPIELYDPSLLGGLVGGQLPREVLSQLDASSLPRKQFEEMEELLMSLTCCEKHAVDQMLYSRRSSASSGTDDDSADEDADDWESLDKAIKTALSEWTEELDFRKRMQDILFSLNLHDLYGGCCKNSEVLETNDAAENYVFPLQSSNSSTSS